ncbi:hypothetical protein QCA50_017920 [Cerrena zonata]|uniref:Uncharacterized protein n=1 Tax=Cerrena zonata TaxID=2478898 RepID=A0AAW0FI10_9APHY
MSPITFHSTLLGSRFRSLVVQTFHAFWDSISGYLIFVFSASLVSFHPCAHTKTCTWRRKTNLAIATCRVCGRLRERCRWYVFLALLPPSPPLHIACQIAWFVYKASSLVLFFSSLPVIPESLFVLRV